MDKSILPDIMTHLKDEEAAESRLIALYLALLQSGVELCLPRERHADFQKKLAILQKDSERHKKMIDGLVKKYQSA